MRRFILPFCGFLLAAVLIAWPARPGARSSPQSTSQHLKIEGTGFLTSDGKPFAWRGITAFRLLDYIADGQEARANEFLAWAARQRLTVVRVLTMVDGFFNLRPEEGRAALPRLLELAAKHGLHVEVVALAATASVPVDLDVHVVEVGRILAKYPNGLLEIANEPVHPTQRPEVHDAARLAALAKRVPSEVPVALGSIERGDGFAAGGYLTWHSPRDNRHEGWGHVLAVADGAALLTRWKKPVVSDEPIGAGPKYIAGRRDDSPARFRAAALVTRLAGLGATFHYEGGLQAAIPAGRELACFNAWNEAWSLLPADVERRGIFRRAGGDDRVLTGTIPGTLGAFERVDGPQGWLVIIGGTGKEPMPLAPGWTIERRQDFEGARLLVIRRR